MQIDQVLLGRFTLPEAHPRTGDYPLYGYLIHHAAGLVLVDTGAGPGHSKIDALFAPDDIDLPATLAAVGVDVADVVMVVNTHLHFDHVGRNHLFPGVPMFAQRADLAAARLPGFTVPEWVDFAGAKWEEVDGAESLLKGIEVIPTPSHTAGHQAVVVRSPERLEVIAGQAVHNADELVAETSAEDMSPAHCEVFTSVARQIKGLAPDRVWFSHDDRPWLPAS